VFDYIPFTTTKVVVPVYSIGVALSVCRSVCTCHGMLPLLVAYVVVRF